MQETRQARWSSGGPSRVGRGTELGPGREDGWSSVGHTQRREYEPRRAKGATTMASDRDPVSRRMRPGAWDAEGFLGEDEVLDGRIADDLATCAALGTTPEVLGRRLLDVLTDGEPTTTIVPGGEAATCPWALERDEVCLRGPGGNPSADRFVITLGDRTLEGHTLSAHLIAVHRFFGGLQSRFRIDPAPAHALLEPDEPDALDGVDEPEPDEPDVSP